MSAFDHIALIFNPGSTGDAPALARDLAKKIDRAHKTIGVRATLTPTQHAGHAAELARRIAQKYKRPLLISVSGDGGYNEVVNGAMQARDASKAARPVVAVMGAGNANDHRRVMRDRSLLQLIKEADVKPLDLIHLAVTAKDFSLSRYAHSYIGYGITPQVGYELNKHGKSFWRELQAVIKTFHTYEPFMVERNGAQYKLDNLIFANVNEMAKFITLDEKNSVHDGKFEVIELRHRSKFHMLISLVRAVLFGFKNPPSYSRYSLKSLAKQPVQLDGEIEWLPAHARAEISARAAAIDSLF